MGQKSLNLPVLLLNDSHLCDTDEGILHCHYFSPRKTISLSAHEGYIVQLCFLWEHVFCLLFGDRKLSVSRKLKMY